MQYKKEDVMDVTSYIFKSPYTSPIQIGQPETSHVAQDAPKESVSQPVANTKQTLQNAAEHVAEARKQEVAPKATTANLDTYA